MGDNYVRIFKKIQEEYNACTGALRYVDSFWHTDTVSSSTELEQVTIDTIRRSHKNIESTYITVLHSTLEGILREYLYSDSDTKTDSSQMIDSAASKYKIKDRKTGKIKASISNSLKQNVHDIRIYRNYLIHKNKKQPPTFTFPEALQILSTFVSKLPE